MGDVHFWLMPYGLQIFFLTDSTLIIPPTFSLDNFHEDNGRAMQMNLSNAMVVTKFTWAFPEAKNKSNMQMSLCNMLP